MYAILVCWCLFVCMYVCVMWLFHIACLPFWMALLKFDCLSSSSSSTIWSNRIDGTQLVELQVQVSSLSIHCAVPHVLDHAHISYTYTNIYMCVCVYVCKMLPNVSCVPSTHVFDDGQSLYLKNGYRHNCPRFEADINLFVYTRTKEIRFTGTELRSPIDASSMELALSFSLSLSSFYCHFLCGQHAGRILSGTRFSFHLFVCPLYVCALLITGDSFGSFASFCCRLPIEMSKQRSPLTNDHNQHNI